MLGPEFAFLGHQLVDGASDLVVVHQGQDYGGLRG
jgi:hypothetical protein